MTVLAVLGRPQTPIPNPKPKPHHPNTNLGHPRTPDGNPGYVYATGL